MKAPNVFSRDDVLRANDAMRRQSQAGSATSQGQTTRFGTPNASTKLSSEEINRAYAEAKKALAAC